MSTKLNNFNQKSLKKDLPDIRPGDTVRIDQTIQEKDKERIQSFEGQVISKKHGKGIPATIIVRRIISGIGVEITFPFHSPTIKKIEVIKRGKARRKKLYYLRGAKGERARLKFREASRSSSEENKT